MEGFNSLEINKIQELSQHLAFIAGSYILENVSKVNEKMFKDNTDGNKEVVTKIDLDIHEKLYGIISKDYPDHEVLSEEDINSNNIDYKKPIWIIDPLDGTTNFVHGYPSFAVSIGLLFQNKPLIAVVLEMPNTKLYTAIKNEGVWCEGQPFTCSQTDSIEKSLLLTGFGYEHGDLWERNMALFKYFTDKTQGVRRLGAAAVDLCHVASGKVDGYWEFDLKPWDSAAGILIAQEAGCVVSQMDGSDYSIYDNNILVANPNIHREMILEIEKII